MLFPKNKPWRNEKHRRLIASLDCIICGKYGPSQCAHINFSKSMGSKASDALTFPACPDCHRHHDRTGIEKQERWQKEWEYTDAVRAILIQRNLWSAEAEKQYQIAIQPLAAVVHADQKNSPTTVSAVSSHHSHSI